MCLNLQFDFTPRVCVLKPRISRSPTSFGVPASVTAIGPDSAASVIVSGSDSKTIPFVSNRIFDT